MKNSIRVFSVFLFLSIISICFSGLCSAQTAMNLRFDLYSRYFYRGFDYNLGKPAFQPNFYFSNPAGVNLNVFTSFGLDKKTEFDEFDISSKYNFNMAKDFSAFAGITGNFFPNTQSLPTSDGKFNFTYELQTGVTYNSGDFSASFLYAHGFRNADGDCIDVSTSYNIKLINIIYLIPVMGSVYQTEYGITGSFRNKLTAIYLYLPFEINFYKYTLIPSYNISYIPSEQMRKINESCEVGYKKILQYAGFSVKYNL
jgi:hypothetical protein